MNTKAYSRWLALETNAAWEAFRTGDDLWELSRGSCYSGAMGTVCIVRVTPNKDSDYYRGEETITHYGLLFPAGSNDICITLVIRIEDPRKIEEDWIFEQDSLVDWDHKISKIARNLASTYNWSTPTPLYFEAFVRAKSFSKQ